MSNSNLSYTSMNNKATESAEGLGVDDIEVTTVDEIKRWTFYDFANSPMSSPIFSFVLPLLLERLATQNVCSRIDIECDNDGDPLNGEEKYLDVLNITPNTFSFLVIGVSVFFQTLSFISFGACADYGNKKKKYLLITSVSGSLITFLYILCIDHNLWWLVGVLTIIVIILFGLSTIYYNAFLPLMVRSHPDYLYEKKFNNQLKLLKIEDELSNRISAQGYMLGYVGALIITIIIGPIFIFFPHKDIWSDNGLTWSLIISIIISGLWWLIFSLYSISGLKTRKGKDMETNENIIIFSWKRTYNTLRNLKKFPQIGKFIIAFFLYSDAYSTIASTGVLYARTELDVSIKILYFLIIEVTIISIVGNYLFIVIQKKYNLDSRCIIIIQLSAFLIICVYGLFFLNSHVISIFIFGLIYGLIIGAIQSFSRSLFTQLIPPGYEAQFFSFFSITDKGSNILGSFVIALLSQYTSLKYGFIYVIFIIIISLPFLFKIDMHAMLDEDSDEELIEKSMIEIDSNNSLESIDIT